MSLKLATLSLTLLALCGCASSRPAAQRMATTATPTPQVAAPEASGREGPQVSDIYVEGDELTYNGYVVEKRHKRVRLDYPSEGKERRFFEDEFSYAVVRRRGKVLATFDGVYSGAGNATRFGLFPFLGGDEKQLLVSQDVPVGRQPLARRPRHLRRRRVRRRS